MVKPKATSLTELKRELPKTLCDMPSCAERAEIIVWDGEYWFTFCDRHNPHNMKIVYPSKEGKQ
jgi:hypothetical protein